MRPSRSLLVLAGLGAAASGVRAQATPCTYEACALRLHYRFLSGTQVIQGREGQSLGTLSTFSPRIVVLENGPPPVAVEYGRFRSAYETSTVLNILGGLVSVAGVVVLSKNGWDGFGTGQGLLIGGGVLNLIANVSRNGALDHLERAIWLYNGTLAGPRPPGPNPPNEE